MISVLDLGLGNMLSVIRALDRLGARPRLVSNAEDLRLDRDVVVPGVGSFDAGMAVLRERRLDHRLKTIAADGSARILGLCLGMQLMFEASTEGLSSGLGIVGGEVVRLQPQGSMRVPHMGWNHVTVSRETEVTERLPKPTRFYFAHSYYAIPQDSSIVTLSAEHGLTFCASFEMDGLIGAQFHPEKSHRYGLEFLKGFTRK